MQGFGDLLRVDLTTESITREEIPLSLRRQYLGGEGINTKLLWDHFLKIDPKIDPRSPDNVLIVGLGPLGGTPFGLGSKTKFTFKSPAYNLFGDSIAGGGLGSSLRWAGIDHIVFTGKAKRPVYLWVEDDVVALRDASHLWGRNAHEAERTIKREVKEENADVACIGRAGENLVGFSCITVNSHRAAGRTGGGCVMGSKNLKAIAAHGTKGIEPSDTAGLLASMDGVLARIGRMPAIVDRFRRLGSLYAVDFYDLVGANAYRNGQLSIMPKETAAELNAAAYLDKLIDHSLSCSPGCQTACSAWQRIQGFESALAKHFVGLEGLKPEFLAIASLGIGPDIPDMPAVLHLNDMCYDYSVDLVEMGNTISFLMELWQREIVTGADLAAWTGGGGDLKWGNWQAAERIITAVAEQSCKLGEMFKDNVYRAAQQIEQVKGVPVVKYVNYGKGGATFTEDQRPFPMWATNMAVSVRGADHLKGLTPVEKMGRKDISMAWFGQPQAGEIHGVALKGAASARAENINCAVNSTGVCITMPTRDSLVFALDTLTPGIAALTGLAFTQNDLYTMGERICNLEKAFNSRLGLRRKDDFLCDRWMNVPSPQGPGKGMKAADFIEQTLDEYYEYHGWDKETSLQRRAKLTELGLDDVADVLAGEDAIAG